MWPWGHAAVGYLLYLGITRRQPRIPLVVFLALALGTQFPDLIDKPLSWSVPVLPTGRSLAHSTLTATLLLGTAAVFLPDRHRDSLTAFAVGYGAHLLADGFQPLLTGEFSDLTWLVWPLLPSPKFETPQSFLAHVRAFEFEPMTLLGVALVGIAAVVWLYRYTASRDAPAAP